MMHPSVMSEIAKQHIEELHNEASTARVARLARRRKEHHSDRPRYARGRLRNALGRS